MSTDIFGKSADFTPNFDVVDYYCIKCDGKGKISRNYAGLVQHDIKCRECGGRGYIKKPVKNQGDPQ